MRAVAYDTAGNSVTSTRVVTIDFFPPVSVLLDYPPVENATITGTVHFKVGAWDITSGIERFEVYDGTTLIASGPAVADDSPWDTFPLDDSQQPPFFGPGFRFGFDWDTSLVAAGPHTLQVYAFDRAGNRGDANPRHVSVLPPTPPPTIAITAPAGGVPVTGNVAITATASSGAGLKRVDFLVNGEPLVSVGQPPYVANWDTSVLPDGYYLLTAVARDIADQTTISETVFIVIERSAPSLNVSLIPAAPAALAGSVRISGEAVTRFGLASITAFVDDVPLETQWVSPFSFSWDTTAVPNGAHTLKVVAVNAGGSSALWTANGVVNNQLNAGPQVVIKAPLEAAFVTDVVSVEVDASDDDGVDRVEFLDGDVVWTTDDSAPFTAVWDTSGLPQGPRTLVARAFDRLGNFTNSAPVHVTIDRAPVLNVMLSLSNGQLVGKAVTVKAHTTDDTLVTSVAYFAGSVLIATATQPPFAVLWSPTTSGAHSLTARATAGGRVHTSPAVVVQADVEAPTVALTAPLPGPVVAGTVRLTAKASDNVGVARVEFFDGSSRVKTITSGPYSFVWNTASVAAGNHKLTARAFDAAGNATTSAAVTVAIDHTLPSVTLTSPANNTKVSGTVKISAAASDNVAVARVEFSVAGVVRCTDASAPYACSWMVPAGAGKTYALQAKAFDTAGNTRGSTVVTVTAR